MPELRSTFHQQLDEGQRDLVRAAVSVTESIMRATDALLAAGAGHGPDGGEG